jgi:hypothetical protein
MRRAVYTLSLYFLAVFAILFPSGNGLAETDQIPAGPEWRTIEARYSTIYIHPDVDIRRLNRKVRIGFYDIHLDDYAPTADDRSPEQEFAHKVDLIFKKAQKVLDMYPRRMHVDIKIYKDRSQLDREYADVFGSHDGIERISFYVHKYTTVYTAEDALREGVLAHELGHAIIDHYFLILPPENIKELLAQYVEIHLED